ncbi:MAG: YihY/virulence factor BrkB family protein [Cyclobacteriaceae bacterium]|nr:YihY/virulence factor BrkB family protein [Cyclobacteriaceae bacterium]
MKYKVRKRILVIPTARTFRAWLKRIRFKRHENLSLYQFLKIFIHNINEDEIMDRANGVAYNFILAIFPTIIFLFTLIPYVSRLFPTITTQSIMNFLSGLVPASMYEVISSTVLDIVDNQRGGLLTFGFVLALFLATNGMNALMRAFNACYRTVENRNFFRMRLTALGLTVMMALSLFLSILLLIVGQIVIDYLTENIQKFGHLNLDDYTIYMFLVLRFIVVFIVFFLAISCIYYFGPAIHYNWSFFSWGSLIASLTGIGLSYGFSYYVTNFSSYNKVYGSIGVLIALMAWVQLLTIVLLFGYEINASLHYGVKTSAINRHMRDMRKVKSSR